MTCSTQYFYIISFELSQNKDTTQDNRGGIHKTTRDYIPKGKCLTLMWC